MVTKRTLIVLFMLVLAGCAQTPKKPVTSIPSTSKHQHEKSLKNHQQQVSSLNHWQAEGRMAAKRGQKGGNASFVWVQQGDNYQIKLFGPFGAGSVHITGSPQFVELREANGKTSRAQSPEMLLKKTTGLQVPVAGLRYWMRGIPSPQGQYQAQTFDNQGLLQHFSQQGWVIDYDGYQSNQNLSLPSKLSLQNGDVKIKMVVTSWKALPITEASR